ncbi:tripartite tricarboxylate transporter TctB family protein [Micromonospora sp. NPDC003197]
MTPPTTAAPGTERAAARSRRPLGPLVLGAVMLATGAFLFWYAYHAAGGDFAPAGPWLAPVVVSGGWLLLALWYLIQQFVSPDHATPPADSATVEDSVPNAAADADDSAPAATTSDDPASEATADADDSSDPSEPERIQWLQPVLLAVALCGYVFALEPVGFVLASAVFFVATARILGSRQLLRDVVIGVPLALVIYLAFTYLLAIQLPSGVLPL